MEEQDSVPISPEAPEALAKPVSTKPKKTKKPKKTPVVVRKERGEVGK